MGTHPESGFIFCSIGNPSLLPVRPRERNDEQDRAQRPADTIFLEFTVGDGKLAKPVRAFILLRHVPRKNRTCKLREDHMSMALHIPTLPVPMAWGLGMFASFRLICPVVCLGFSRHTTPFG